MGVDFFARIIEVQDGTRIKLQLWDTAGQERFRSITKSYYRNSVGALLVYDVCNRSSFEHIPLWMMEAKRHIEPHRPVFALVGCKVDLVDKDNKNGARREVSCEEARMFAEENGNVFINLSGYSSLKQEELCKELNHSMQVKNHTTKESLWNNYHSSMRFFPLLCMYSIIMFTCFCLFMFMSRNIKHVIERNVKQ